eukprot:565345-Amorphochlora_amoeboformis.AAC.1
MGLRLISIDVAPAATVVKVAFKGQRHRIRAESTTDSRWAEKIPSFSIKIRLPGRMATHLPLKSGPGFGPPRGMGVPRGHPPPPGMGGPRPVGPPGWMGGRPNAGPPPWMGPRPNIPLKGQGPPQDLKSNPNQPPPWGPGMPPQHSKMLGPGNPNLRSLNGNGNNPSGGWGGARPQPPGMPNPQGPPLLPSKPNPSQPQSPGIHPDRMRMLGQGQDRANNQPYMRGRFGWGGGGTSQPSQGGISTRS